MSKSHSERAATRNLARRCWRLLLAAGVLLLLCGPASATVNVTGNLDAPTISGTVASFPYSLTFSGDAWEEMFFFAIDVSPSDDILKGAGNDYSAFSFDPASPLLDDWFQIGFFNDPGFESSVEFETPLSLPTGTYDLGVLNLDFGAAGVPGGTTITVSVASVETIIGAGDPFDPSTSDFYPVDFGGGGSQTFTTPGGGGVIPEPASALVWALLAPSLFVIGRKLRRRS